MKKNELMDKLSDIFRDVMDNNEIELNDETTADDIEEWDSLTHLQLVVAIEKEFNVKITAKELLMWKNVGEMVDAIIGKMK